MNKNQNPKSSVSLEDLLRSQFRKNHLTHDAELQLLIALAETLGIKVDYNEQNNVVSIKKPETAPERTRAQTSPDINSSMLYQVMKPVASQTIKESLQETPIYVSASVDNSVHIENNQVVMNTVTSLWEKWLKDAASKVLLQVGLRTNGHELVYQATTDHYYKLLDPSEYVAPSPPSGATEKEKKPSLLKRFFKWVLADMMSSISKAFVYVLCYCSFIMTLYFWIENARMVHVVKEYGIVKPVLMEDPYYNQMIHVIDSVLVVDDIDDVIQRIHKNQHHTPFFPPQNGVGPDL